MKFVKYFYSIIFSNTLNMGHKLCDCEQYFSSSINNTCISTRLKREYDDSVVVK